CQHYNSLPYSF
nr:immunoglobulin light chain junction region [Macaca mulatta]MOW13742.1 immunoglobulin light chain junction region [Macaca mulatta]MOW55500.1 immunoglobulin light chain junction region [Macaca mulatta]